MLQPQEILEAALQLPQEQREDLVDKLAASLDLGDLGEYWEAEIQRRIEDVDAGRVATIPADEVFARLEQRFGGKVDAFASIRSPRLSYKTLRLGTTSVWLAWVVASSPPFVIVPARSWSHRIDGL